MTAPDPDDAATSTLHTSVSRPLRLRTAALVWALSGALMFGAGWWAAGVTTDPPSVPEEDLPTIDVEVELGTVEQAVTYAASASWPFRPAGVNGHTGTLTSVDVSPGSTVDAGTVLYTVDLRPAVAAAGAVPAFRDIGIGATGADVEQLEGFLRGQGLFTGTPDAAFTETTDQAVRRWQRQVGTTPDGVVRRGDLVFLPELPTAVFVDPDLEVGAAVETGRAAVMAVTGSPEFTVTLVRDQADLVPLSAPVRVSYGPEEEQVWDGVVASTTAVPPGEVSLTLTAPDGTALCGETCADVVPVAEESMYTADLYVVPPTEGPTVPTAAITTGPDGGTGVRLTDGTRVPVDVLASAFGRSVVSGVDVGDRVRLLQDRP